MQLRKLILTNFKNYRQGSLELHAPLVYISGVNGAGKTNLLDAIHYLSLCRGHFSKLDQPNMAHGQSFFRIEGHYRGDGREEEVVCTYSAERKKAISRNGEEYPRLSDHIGWLPLVFICPDDIELINEYSESRRRFIDQTLGQTDADYLRELMRYNRLLSQRNAAIKQGAATGRHAISLIRAYDEPLAASGTVIFEKRNLFFEDFLPVFSRIYKELSGDKEAIEGYYRSSLQREALSGLLRDKLDKDLVAGRTLEGIHRDDIILLMHGHPVRKIGSQGQKKSFLLALKLAQALFLRERERSKRGVFLLLDDVFDKLDIHRIHNLFTLIRSLSFSQVFITDTHKQRILSLLKEIGVEFQHVEVDNGRFC